MCRDDTQENTDAVRNVKIIVVISLLCLFIGATILIIILSILMWNFKRRARRPKLVENVAYNCHSRKIKTDLVDSDVVTSTNPAYTSTSETIHNSEAVTAAYTGTSEDLNSSEAATVPDSSVEGDCNIMNVAYVESNITLHANLTYGAVESGTVEDNSLEYDYVMN